MSNNCEKPNFIIKTAPIPVILHEGLIVLEASDSFREFVGCSESEVTDLEKCLTRHVKSGSILKELIEGFKKKKEFHTDVIIYKKGSKLKRKVHSLLFQEPQVGSHLNQITWFVDEACHEEIAAYWTLQIKMNMASSAILRKEKELNEINFKLNVLNEQLKLDIAGRKKAEAASRRNKIELNALFDETFQFIGLMNLDGILLEANKSALQLSGIETTNVIGKPFWETPWWTHSPQLQKKLRQAIKDVASGQFVRFEATHPAKDGALHYVDFSLKPVKDESGKVIFMIPEGRDITERKKTEAELEKAYNTLKETQAQLIQAGKMEVIGRLASGVAHEVKNPLAIIAQGIEYFSNNAGPDNEKASVVLSTMNNAVQRADDIVMGLLDFSTLSKLEIKPAKLESVIDNALTLVKNNIGQKNIKLLKNYNTDNASVDIDKNKIEQVLINIFMNAIDSMDTKGELKIKTDVKGIESDGKMLVVEIEDNGPGIPNNILNKIYDPFFTTKREKGGSGLGLYIVKNIMDMHKAALKIENRKNSRGTKVTLTFRG
jgi:PAS domain S-box-containing protein